MSQPTQAPSSSSTTMKDHVAAADFYTVGHSNRSLAEFLDLLQASAIERVLDVRKLPGSSKYPQFNQGTLYAALADHGIELVRLEALTGRRPVSKEVPFEVNAWWDNRSFHNYADHALSVEFREALAELRRWGTHVRISLLCSEAVWWRCHRRIIADHLLAHNDKVLHILGKNDIKPASLSAGAVIGSASEVTYPGGR